ncbi:MAG: hypothetical protein HZA50_13600 [Planctomycetes bacterium]|nr:hypothetical protein [Planctomycetota bacterium]
MRTILTFLTAAIAAIFPATVCLTLQADQAADQKVENPQYRMWSSFKPGSSVRWVSTDSQGKTAFAGEATMTLKKVTAESVIVEMRMSMTLAGGTTTAPSQEIEIAARVGPELAPKMETLGQEEIQVGEKKMSCKKVQVRKTTADGTITITSWLSDELPGGLAKSLTLVADRDGREISQRTTTAVEFKAEK